MAKTVRKLKQICHPFEVSYTSVGEKNDLFHSLLIYITALKPFPGAVVLPENQT